MKYMLSLKFKEVWWHFVSFLIVGGARHQLCVIHSGRDLPQTADSRNFVDFFGKINFSPAGTPLSYPCVWDHHYFLLIWSYQYDTISVMHQDEMGGDQGSLAYGSEVMLSEIS